MTLGHTPGLDQSTSKSHNLPSYHLFSLILISFFLAKQKFERVLNIIKDLDYSDKISLFEIRQSLHQHKGGFGSVYRVQVGERDLAVKLITLGCQLTDPIDNGYVCGFPFILFISAFLVYFFILIQKMGSTRIKQDYAYRTKRDLKVIV